MNKKNVLFLDHAIEMGGAEYSLYYLIKYLDTQSINMVLMVPPKSKLATMAESLNTSVTYNDLNSPKEILRFLRNIVSIKRFIKKNNINIIYCNTYRTIIYGVFLKLITNCKVIWHVRDYYKNYFLKFIYAIFSSRIICISKSISEQFSRLFSNKISIVYNGVDLEYYNPEKVPGNLKEELDITQDKILVGMVGRIDRWKGIHLLIEAGAYIINELNKKEYVFVIVGESILTNDQSYKIELKEMVKKNKLENNVLFLGQRDDIPNLMKSFDLTVNYSDNEPFGRVIIESLAMGTPVIVNNTGGAPEIIRNIGNGLITKERDSRLLAKSILEMTKKRLDIKQKIKYIKKVRDIYDARIPSRKVSSILKQL
jgi:L-malate glycosyltransferase